MDHDSTSPVLAVAKKQGEDNQITLYDGTVIRVVPVSAALVDEVTRRIKMPEIPMVRDEANERDVPNPGDPNYLAACEEVQSDRLRATITALTMFGVELVSGLPTDGKWIGKLKYMERQGLLDLSKFDFNDPYDAEFLYKRFIAVSGDIMEKISKVSGVSGEEIKAAEESFRSSESG